MKQTRRMIRLFSLGLTLLAAFTIITYVTMVKTNSSRWLNSAQNTRISEARKTTLQGSIYDTGMVAIAWSDAVGERSYIGDQAARLALSHTIGDQSGMSATGVEIRHATTLLGLSDITGTNKTIQRLMGDDPSGYDIVLTVSSELSKYAASLFPNGSRGACVIINYKTGAILAKISLPAFDPANMSGWVEDTAYYDRSLQYRYAPGSTFKIVTLASALENLPDAETKRYECVGEWTFAQGTIRCAGGKAHGDMSLQKAFALSCNVTFAKLAYEIGAANLKTTAQNFGFNDEFMFEDITMYASHCLSANDSVGEVIQTGFGQGTTEATPLHMAMIAGAIANEGVMMEPKLIKEVRRHNGGAVSYMSTGIYKTVCSSDEALNIARYMYQAVNSSDATGSQAKISGYRICGKTGSAEFSNDKEAGTHAWYVGFVMDDEHPYAIAVIVEKGGSGGSVAAPIAAKALKKAIELNLY